MSISARRLQGVTIITTSGGGSDTTAPTAPTSLTATATSSSAISLSWNAATDNVGVTRYRVYRGGERIGQPTGTSFNNTGLSASTTYSYYVTAVDAAGNESAHSNTASAKTQGTSTPSTTQIGVDPSLNGSQSLSNWHDEIIRVANTLGIDPDSTLPLGNHAKFYDGGNGLLRAAQNFDNSGYTGVPVLCHKVDKTSDFNARLDVITKPEIWVYWQEQGANKGPSTSVYNAAYLHMDQARRAHPNGHLVELCMDGSRSQEAQQQDWQNKNPKAAHVEYVGVDCYRDGNLSPKAPANEFQFGYAWHQAVKGTYPEYKGWVVPEFGLGRRNSSGVLQDPQERADELAADFAWLKTHECYWVNYWEEDNTGNEGITKDWRTAPDAPVKNVLVSNITRESLY